MANKRGQRPYDRKLFGTPIYLAWQGMKNRCQNPNEPAYQQYGARGIKVCERWQMFADFAEDMLPSYRPGLSLDRINNDGHYEPGNCRWADRTQQANNRRNSRYITVNGVTRTLAEWVRALGLKGSTVRQRYYCYGWPIEKALEMEG